MLLFGGFFQQAQTKSKNYGEDLKFTKNETIPENYNDGHSDLTEESNAGELFYLNNYEYLVKQEKIRAAIETLNKGIDIYPKSILLLNARAEFYTALKIYSNAIIDYKKIINLVTGKELVSYKLKLATVKFITRDFQETASLTKDILKIDPLHIDTLNMLAALYVELGNYESAKKILHSILDRNPKHTFTIINLGFCYQKQSQHDEAIKLFNIALELSPDNPLALSNRALSQIDTNTDQAIEDINKSIGMFKTNSYAYMVRGRILLKRGQLQKACANFKMAKTLKFSEQYGTEVDNLLMEICAINVKNK